MFCAYYDVLCGVSVILNSQFLNWAKLGCIVLFFESNACMNYCIIDWNENVSLGSEATMKQAHVFFGFVYFINEYEVVVNRMHLIAFKLNWKLKSCLIVIIYFYCSGLIVQCLIN